MKKYFLLFLLSCSLTLIYAQNALSFDGVNDFAAAGAAGATGSSDRTVELWIKTSNSISTQQVLVDWGDMAQGTRFTLNLINFGKLRIEVGGNGFNSNSSVADGNWHHVAVTYKSSATTKASLYIDGLLELSQNFTVPVNTSNINGVILGRRNDGINYYTGLMDEVRIWSAARSATQISNTMNKTFCTAKTGLLYNYSFDQGIAGGNNSGMNSATEPVSGNHASLIGFSLSGNSSNFLAGAAVQNEIDKSISRNASALIANDSLASYQWFDCSNLSFNIQDSNRVFVAPTNGSYALALSKGFCIDSSACLPIINVGIQKRPNVPNYELQNPVEDKIRVRIPSEQLETSFYLYDSRGRLLEQKENFRGLFMEMPVNYSKGIYYLKVQNTEGFKRSFKLLFN